MVGFKPSAGTFGSPFEGYPSNESVLELNQCRHVLGRRTCHVVNSLRYDNFFFFVFDFSEEWDRFQDVLVSSWVGCNGITNQGNVIKECSVVNDKEIAIGFVWKSRPRCQVFTSLIKDWDSLLV